MTLDRFSVVWLGLVAATLLTALLGLEQHAASRGVGVALMVIGFVKLRLVMIHFMELRDAPRGLRLAVEAYAGGVLAVLVVLYFAV